RDEDQRPDGRDRQRRDRDPRLGPRTLALRRAGPDGLWRGGPRHRQHRGRDGVDRAAEVPARLQMSRRAPAALAVLLIAAGTFALAKREFSYTKESHEAKLGSLEFELKEKQRVELPVWAGVAAIAAGTALLVLKR